MSGHSKWANIKHKKAKADAARGVNFAKFSREIIIAAKIGGGDLNGNFRLRTAVEKAKAVYESAPGVQVAAPVVCLICALVTLFTVIYDERRSISIC